MSATSTRVRPLGAATSRRPAALALLVLSLALVAATLLVLPGDVPQGQVDVLRDFTPEQVALEDAFHREIRPPAYASLVLGLVVAGVLGLTPLGARLAAAVSRPLGGGWFWTVVLGTLAVSLVARLVTLPLAVRSQAVLREYGLSVQDWGGWAADVGKSLLVGVGLTCLVLVPLVALARWSPRHWWAWGAGVSAALVMAGSLAYPVVVEPLFNRFTPLPAGELRTELLALAERDGVQVQDVLVADASRRTTSLNAYVSGYGPSRRIVVYDTLLEQSSPQEVALVVAHELGHAEDDDVLKGTLLGALGAAAGVCLLALLLSWPPLLRRAGVHGPGDPRAVALLVFLFGVASLLSAPYVNHVSRSVEARADVHALDLTGDRETFVDAQVRLATTNLSDLDPPGAVYWWFASHPTAPERIALARAWERLRSGEAGTR